MALKTVDLAGEYDLAREIAAQLLNHMWRTYEDYEPHTILPFTLILDGKEHKVSAGRNTYRR